MQNSNSIEVSSARRHRHYRGYRHYGYRPYYRAIGLRLLRGRITPTRYDPYYRPYYRPGVSVGVGPFGFGFGF